MHDVLIVGAGPTGLVLALWLARLRIRVRLIEKASEPATTSRALGVQARTLEFYDQLGIADKVVALGRLTPAVNLWIDGRKVARAFLGDMGEGLSPHPYLLMFSQDQHERLLSEELMASGINIERGTELLDFEDTGDSIRARLKRANGAVEPCTASYLAGCDGSHSAARETLSIGFPGGTYARTFYVADVEGTGTAIDGEVHVAMDSSDFLALFPLKRDGHVRLVGTLRDDVQHDHENLSWHDVSRQVIAWMKIDVSGVNWFSTYRVHHRVANRFRAGRAFLLGDAAHIHSPVGAQGMNTGIGDAVNLAWKLAAVIGGNADAAILDTYEAERIAFARRLVATTDQAFTAVTSSTLLARTLRLRVVPFLVPQLFALEAVRRFMFRTVSQTAIEYRASALSSGRAGGVHGGDRLPWVRTASDAAGSDNFAPLRSLDWQVHVYGEAQPALRSACARRGLHLAVFPWRPEMSATGLRRDALYLIRPDGYVGLADRNGSAAALDSYLTEHNVRAAYAARP